MNVLENDIVCHMVCVYDRHDTFIILSLLIKNLRTQQLPIIIEYPVDLLNIQIKFLMLWEQEHSQLILPIGILFDGVIITCF